MIAVFLFDNVRLLLLTILLIVATGVSSFLILPRLEDPVLGKRVAVVTTAFPGANAERVESLVTIPLEEVLGGISQIKQIRSNSQTAISNITIELEDEVDDFETVWGFVRSQISDAQSVLPDTCLQSQLDVLPLKAFAAILAVQGKQEDVANLSLLRVIARDLRAELISIPGTDRVEVFGDPGEHYVVEIEPVKLASIGLSTAAIAQQLVNDEPNQPAGDLSNDDSNLALELTTDAMPIDRIAKTLIQYGPRGETAKLSEIGRIERRIVQPASNLALINGRRAIVMGILVADDQRVDQWSDHLDQAITNFGNPFPEDVSVEVFFSQREHIERRMRNLFWNLGIGTLAVMFVVLVLMGWRSMIVVGTALPLSALMVLAAMRVLWIPIHQVSVTGLIVALGLLIDNAIVIVEEVRNRIISGANPRDAIAGGVRHLAMPLFGSTLTTALAFLPIATLPGPPGEFVGSIAISVILAISASFFLAMTIIPALVGWLQVEPSQKGLISFGLTIPPLQKLYEWTLRIAFRAPFVGLLLAVILPVSGFLALKRLPEQFFPPSDRAQIQIEVERPAGDTLAATVRTVESIREIVGGSDRVRRQYWFVGGSAPTFFYNIVPRRRSTSFYAQGIVDLKDARDVGELVRELQIELDRQSPECRVVVRQLEQGPPFDAPIEVRVFGPELAELQSLGHRLRLLLGQTSHVIHTRSDTEETVSKISLIVDERAANEAALDESQIAGQLYTTLNGADAGKVYEAGEEFPVLVKLSLTGPGKIDRLAAMPLYSMNPPASSAATDAAAPAGVVSAAFSPITLANLTKRQLDSDVGAIVRINGKRTNEVKAYIQSGVLPSIVINEFTQRLEASDFVLPSGYSLQFGGETEQRSDAVSRLIANATVLFGLMLLTLVASFRSFRCALIIACVGGMSVGLGPLALSSFGYPFGFMAIVGTMGLVGIAINDSIVVLAAIRADKSALNGDVSGLVKVVSGCTRHIVATTLTTMAGFAPLILSGGDFWPPLAMTIAGGVGGATLLALYLVPSLHLLLTVKFR